MSIDKKYKEACDTYSDIYRHLPTLKRYAEGKEVIELGVRAIVSTWGFLAGKPKRMLSVDIKYPSEYGGDLTGVELMAAEEGIEFFFKKADSLEIELPMCDVLFIDTLHTYEQLSKELNKHHDKAREYIILHDTHGEEAAGVLKALTEFLDQHEEWKIHEDFTYCNGLTICARVV